MESTVLFFSGIVLICGAFHWLVSGPKSAANLAQVQDKYSYYASFFCRPKEITTKDKVPDFVNDFYDLVTDIYEWGWGQSFHFCPTIPGISWDEASRRHESRAANLIRAKPGQRLLDVGCGVGGPMRTIASHSGADVVGITINQYQVNRANDLNKKARLDHQCQAVCGNFLEMPFPSETFDGAYSIEATCHAPRLEDVYAEVFRVLKPGTFYVSFEWVTTSKYRPEDSSLVEIIHEIELGNAVPGLQGQADVAVAARKVGFEVIEERDLALPPAGPWWTRLKMSRVASWRNQMLVTTLEALRVLPKGTTDVHKMLMKTGDGILRGGEAGIFTPMYMILCRKPA